MKNTLVSEVMSRDIITVNSDEKLSKASELMSKNHFRHLPVMDGDKLIGILSKTDLMRLGFNDQMGDLETQIGVNLYEVLNVGQVMVAHPMFIGEKTTLADASQKMIDEEFHALPVVDENNKLSGIITSSDALKFFISN